MKQREISKIEWLFALAMFILFYVAIQYSSQVVIFIGIIGITFLVFAICNKGKFQFRFDGFHIYLIAFCIFCYMSVLWAENSNYALKASNVLLEIVVAMFVFYLIFNSGHDIQSLLKLIKWGCYILLGYEVVAYGLNSFMALLQSGARLSNAVLNANTVGMCAAYAIVINIYFILYDKRLRWADILIIPALVILAVTGSRKALIILILGVVALFILRNFDKKRLGYSFLKIIIIVAVLFVLFLLLLRLPMFNGIMDRMADLITLITGNGTQNTSGWLRFQYIKLGWQIFKEHPVLGVGIDNARLYTLPLYGYDHYLHNNYAELLACGGLVGSIIYYSIYAYIIFTMIRFHSRRDREWDICMVLLVIFLIMDYGMVSYSVRGTYVYLLLFWLEAKKLKNGDEYIIRDNRRVHVRIGRPIANVER